MYYHVYNRGAHKAPIFLEPQDYQRFLRLLYISNSTRSFMTRDFADSSIFTADRGKNIVSIAAYCLMPNHFHIVLEENDGCGMTKFMRKLCTGYSMYYNKKYKHSGTIFQGKYKSKSVIDDVYFQVLMNYVHLNPFGIEEPMLMKSTYTEHFKEAFAASSKYEYSSLKDYLGENRPQKVILAEVRPT